ncbi:potassium channel family protein [Paenibacillus planticolens]|nr:potassium channel family protein [Paenibacillus planticolens]
MSKEIVIKIVLFLYALFGLKILLISIGVIIHLFKLFNLSYLKRFEIGLLLVFYPLSILMLIMFFKDYRNWIKKNLKQMTILLYLFVWIWFGSFYYYIAQRADGDDFVFSEQARIETTLKGFLKEGQYDSFDSSRLKSIIANNQYKKEYIGVGSNEYLTLDQTGKDWGDIYENMLGKEGYSFYSYKISPESIVIEPSMLNYNTIKNWGPYINKEFVEVTINLYKTKEKLFDSHSSVFYFEQSNTIINNIYLLEKPDKQLKLYFDKNELNIYLSIFKNEKIDTHLSNMIASSHTLLDGKFLDIFIGLNGYNKYQIEDFWYFSAVTITTLGFGDITPNSSAIRVAVMIEALIGIILIGIYISIITSNKDKARKIVRRKRRAKF